MTMRCDDDGVCVGVQADVGSTSAMNYFHILSRPEAATTTITTTTTNATSTTRVATGARESIRAKHEGAAAFVLGLIRNLSCNEARRYSLSLIFKWVNFLFSYLL